MRAWLDQAGVVASSAATHRFAILGHLAVLVAPVALNPAESAARIQSDREKWGRLMRAAGIEPQSL